MYMQECPVNMDLTLVLTLAIKMSFIHTLRGVLGTCGLLHLIQSMLKGGVRVDQIELGAELLLVQWIKNALVHLFQLHNMLSEYMHKENMFILSV